MPDLTKMNPAQRKAVTHAGGPLLVLAGPGSGKTFTVTSRILYLIDQGVPPDRILVITFTREAAQAMQRRFQEASDAFYPVGFGTFHSVFFQMLQRSGALRSARFLNGSEKLSLLLPIMKKFCGSERQADDDLREDAAVFLSAVSYYKNTLREQKAMEMLPARWRPFFRDITAEYGRAAEAGGGMDFDDMLTRCREMLLGDDALRKFWQGRFSHILIDEFQDINPVQYETVKLLAGEGTQIFAVGDDDQAIYGFRGSEPECLKRFQRDYGAEQILLDINYRSHPRIVSASLAVIGENKDRFEKRLRPAPGRGQIDACRAGGPPDGAGMPSGKGEDPGRGRVRLIPLGESEEQYDYLLRRLRGFRETEGREGRECAVLFRTNAAMQGLAVRLRTAGIPFVMNERMQSVYEHFIARDVMAYLRLAGGEEDRGSLLRILNRPSRYLSREDVGNACSVGQLLRRLEEGASERPGGGPPIKAPERGRRFVRQMEALGKLSPATAVSYVRKAIGYETYLRGLAGGNGEKLAEWLELLEWLRADAARFAHWKEWKRAQEAHTEALLRNGGKKRAESKKTEEGAVRLMTVHGSKGLEFDTVIIADCNETVFPHGRFLSEAEVEEERRVFYVAMTRAKENLELLYLSGTEERPRLPSRFLNPLLGDHSSSTSSSNSQLSRYSSNASDTFSNSSSSSI